MEDLYRDHFYSINKDFNDYNLLEDLYKLNDEYVGTLRKNNAYWESYSGGLSVGLGAGFKYAAQFGFGTLIMIDDWNNIPTSKRSYFDIMNNWFIK